MWQQTKQVGMTYVTRRWVMVGMLAIVVLFMAPIILLLTTDGEAQEFTPILMMVGLAAGAIGLWIVTMAKWQFAHPRSRLTPGFTSPHIGLLSVLMITSVGVCPLVIAKVGGYSLLGFAAFAAVIACCQIWAYHRNNGLLALSTTVVVYSSMAPSLFQFWSGTEIQQALVHVGLLTAAWGGLLFWLWRLTQLNEEMSEYQPLVLEVMMGSSRVQRRQQGRLVAKQLTRIPLLEHFIDRWHDRIGEYPRSPRRRIVWLLRYGFGGLSFRLTAAISAVAVAVMFLIVSLMLFVLRSNFPSAILHDFSVEWAFLLFPIAMPTLLVPGSIFMRWPQLSSELLRPLSRVQLIDGLIRVLMLNVALMWFELHATVMVVAYVVSPDLFEPRIVATYLVLSIAFQPFLFVILLRIYCHRGYWVLPVGAFGVVMAVFGTFALWWFKRTDWGDAVFVQIALLVALCSIAMLSRVRRRWLNLEFG